MGKELICVAQCTGCGRFGVKLSQKDIEVLTNGHEVIFDCQRKNTLPDEEVVFSLQEGLANGVCTTGAGATIEGLSEVLTRQESRQNNDLTFAEELGKYFIASFDTPPNGTRDEGRAYVDDVMNRLRKHYATRAILPNNNKIEDERTLSLQMLRALYNRVKQEGYGENCTIDPKDLNLP